MSRKKNQTFNLPERSQPWTVNCSVSARNLKTTDLGGVIFGCTYNTIQECHFKQLFGLPASHFPYVRNIEPGLPLFLFNYSDRKLHGIYDAASKGQMNINPYGWTDGSESTQYPAQVRIQSRMQCQPLLEEQYKPVIAQNYYDWKHFRFELDRAQASKLIAMFSSLPQLRVPPWGTSLKALQVPVKRQESKEIKKPSLGTEVAQSGMGLGNESQLPQAPIADEATNPCHKKWSSLFNTKTISVTRNENEEFIFEGEFPCYAPCWDEEIQLQGTSSSGEITEEYSEESPSWKPNWEFRELLFGTKSGLTFQRALHL